MSDDPVAWGARPVEDGPLAWGAQSAEEKPKPNALQKAIEPVTSYPETYARMNKEARDQMSEGVEQAQRGTVYDAAVGAGKTALGGLGYVTSPINAALRTVVGKPLEENTGIPKEYSEFAAGMLLPIPKRLPGGGSGAKPVPVPTRADLGRAADEGYKEYRAVGGEFSPEISGALADNVTATLNSKGAYSHLADPVHKTVDLLRKEGPTSSDELRSVLEGLGTLRTDPDSKVRRAANIATAEISQFLSRNEPEAASALAKASGDYAAMSRAKTLDQAGEIADLRTGRAGYGGNAVNSMRQVLSPIVEKAIKGNKQGFSPEEIGALNEIVTGNTVTNTLRGIGQLSPSKGAISTTLAAGTLGASGVVGAAANKLAAFLTSKQIDRFNELVRKRSPAYEAAVDKASDKFFTASDDFLVNPTQAGLIKTVVASRALSAGLARDGIQIPSGDFLRRLQGPSGAAAEDEQPEPGLPSQ
jgi:hypothetical protein